MHYAKKSKFRYILLKTVKNLTRRRMELVTLKLKQSL